MFGGGRRVRWLQPPRYRSGSRRGLLTLAIESSCDDTCVCIAGKRSRHDQAPDHLGSSGPAAKLFFNERITSHSVQGGIHPIVALDSHRAYLADLVSRSLPYLPAASDPRQVAEATIRIEDGSLRLKPDFVSVTRGPGMRSNLSCGLDTAKGLATAWQIPLLGVHHMHGHLLTPRLAHALENENGTSPEFPFLNLLVSGGHTLLVHSTGLTDHAILASTNDTSIGDALDKIGRLVLPTDHAVKVSGSAFAKELSNFAFPSPDDFARWNIPKQRFDEIHKEENSFGWKILTPLADTKQLVFSFSGIASRVHSLWEERKTMVSEISREERLMFARTALGTAFEHLGGRTILALERLKKQGTEVKTLVVSGGVAANDFLRYLLRSMLDARGFTDLELVFPPASLCTDNAAMIAWTGLEMFEAGYESRLSCYPLRKWSLDNEGDTGGILGVDGWKRR